jgi:hypothetical protein
MCQVSNRARVEGRADGPRHVSVVLVHCLLDPLGLGQMGGEAEVSMRRLLSRQADPQDDVSGTLQGKRLGS